MKRTYSAIFIDFVFLEPLLAILLGALALYETHGGLVVSPEAQVDLAVALLIGVATTVVILISLWTFLYLRLPQLDMAAGRKVAWAIALLVAAPLAVPIFFWRHLRHEFQPPANP